jgi:hypothetical protein
LCVTSFVVLVLQSYLLFATKNTILVNDKNREQSCTLSFWLLP